MSNTPEIIPFGKRSVRLVTMNGVTKFSATDICNILGYPKANKILGRYCDSTPEYIQMRTAGGPQYVRVIDIEDIFDILEHCRSRNAKQFRKWIEETVIPYLMLRMRPVVDPIVIISLGTY